MKIFLFIASRRGHAVFKKLIETKANIAGVLILVEDPHEEQLHPKIGCLAKENGIPLFYTTEVKPSEYEKLLTTIQPDIAFAISWRYLITKEAYNVPPKGTLIIHDSLLPRYRGFAPMNWAIINGEKETGVTLFHIAEGVDCGPIVDQLSLEITLNDTAKTIDDKLIKLYEDIIIKNLPGLEAGTVKAIPQNEELATYTCKRTPEDGEINWNQSTLQIYNLIRGLTHPFPGAYTTFRGKKVFIWQVEISEKMDKYAGRVPGRIVGKRNGKIEVLTGDGLLRISQLQVEGEAEVSAENWAVSVKDTLGR